MTSTTTWPMNPCFPALPASELLSPAGYQPEFLRSLLRSGAIQSLFNSSSTGAGSLDTVRQAAYYSVELALSLGITVSLFTAPVRRFAPELWRDQLETSFLTGGALGGMMITEPGCGTDMLACQTICNHTGKHYDLRGLKHWAGLTGLADYWLVLAKDGHEGKGFRFPSLNFYICRNDPESFRVTKRYMPGGLRSIPYGITEIKAHEGVVMAPLLSGSKTQRFRLIHSILHRSRISIAAITCGATQRLQADAEERVQTRQVFGRPLADYGQVQARIAEIASARAISEVLFDLCCRAATTADATPDGEVDGLTANIVKVVASDLAFASATSASQLLGGDSYRMDTYIGRATADLRPFRIFEGSNDVLCEAIWLAVEKAAKTGGPAFAAITREALARVGLPAPDAPAFAPASADEPTAQGLRCLGGRILANAISLGWCLDHGLSPAVCRPLISRMRRDFATAETGEGAAGLIEY